MRELCERALDTAKRKGATYADIRICTYKQQTIETKDERVKSVESQESLGFGIRTIVNGAWGFASSDKITKDEIEKVTILSCDIAKASAQVKKHNVELVPVPRYQDHWKTPYKKDPFVIPIENKIALLLNVNKTMLKVKGIKTVFSFMDFGFEHKFFASSEGSFIEQEIMRAYPSYTAFAVGEGKFESRTYQVPPLNIGYEHIENCGLLENAERVASEAVEKLNASPGPIGVKKDLIILPTNLSLTIHESVAHPTELDRALGWEADFAGTTFCTLDQLGKLKYGSEKMNIIADRTLPNGRGTCGYDDDGVKTKEWYIIKNGVFVGYQTTRDTAKYIGENESNGCSYADSWSSIQFLRIPNLSLAANPKGLTLEQLIEDTKDGILIDGWGSYSIDQQRRNFQFGGDAFWEIKNGKKIRMLKDVTYCAQTLDFWRSLDEVCNQKYWVPYGVTTDGKGQPMQIAQQTHGSAPARFRQIEVGGAMK